MRRIWSSFKLNMVRNYSNKLSIVMTMLVIPLVVIASFYVTKIDGNLGTIAVVGENNSLIRYLEDNNIDYEIKNKVPSTQDVYMRSYIGTIKTENNIETYISYCGEQKSKFIEKIILRDYSIQDKKGNIPEAFFLSLSILLIQAVLNMKMFIEDRRKDIIARLKLEDFNEWNYILSYLIFNWISLLIPYGISVLICSIVFFQVSFIRLITLFIVCIFITGLFSGIALLICCCIKDNASAIMSGNIIAVFSTLLSGMFGKTDNNIFLYISNYMPQKRSYLWLKSMYDGYGMININLFWIIICFIITVLMAAIIYIKSEKK